MCGRLRSSGYTRPGRFGPRGLLRGLARLEAFWAVSSAASKPSSVGAALAEQVNQRRGSWRLAREAHTVTSCLAVGAAGRCLQGDRERQRLGDTGRALPAERRGGSAAVLAVRADATSVAWRLVVIAFTKAGNSQHLCHQLWVSAARTARPRSGLYVGVGDTAVATAIAAAESVITPPGVGRAAPATDM